MAICGNPCRYDEFGHLVDPDDPNPPLCGQALGHSHEIHVPWGVGFWFVQGGWAMEKAISQLKDDNV